MSLYHQLETIPIPGIGSMKIGGTTMQDEEMPIQSASFAPPPQAGQNDPFIASRQEPAQVQPPTQVLDVAGRFFGQGQGTDRKRLVLEPEDVNADE